MKAVVCTDAELKVVDRPDPIPGRGQVRSQDGVDIVAACRQVGRIGTFRRVEE